VKTFRRDRGKIVLTPANALQSPMVYDADEVTIYGKVVTVLRQL